MNNPHRHQQPCTGLRMAAAAVLAFALAGCVQFKSAPIHRTKPPKLKPFPEDLAAQIGENLPVGRMAMVTYATGWYEAYVVDKGEKLQQLTNMAAIPGKIAYAEAGHKNADGTWEIQKIPSLVLASADDVALSPDGVWLAYTVYHPEDEDSSIWVVRADGTAEPRQLTRGANDGQLCWAPDSKTIGFVRREMVGSRSMGIYEVDRDCRYEARPLIRLDDLAYSRPAWSPDGETIIFTRRNPSPDPIPKRGYTPSCSIWRLHIRSGDLTRIPLDAFNASDPVWLPDGSRFVYRARKKNERGLLFFSCNPDASDQECLFDKYSDSDPTVSPDGRYIAFISDFRGGRLRTDRVHILDTETREVSVLTPSLEVSWRSISWARCPQDGEEPEER